MLRNPLCTNCVLHKSAKMVCISGHGPTKPDILVVGQNPGREEDRFGRPFVGASGKLIRAELAKAGFDPLIDGTQIRYTNIVRCLSPQNRAPTPKEIKACKPYLDAEIAAVKPKYILTLGGPALKALAKEAKITTAHGKFSQVNGATVMGTFHPAATFRSPQLITEIRNDLARLKRHQEGTLGATQDAFKYRVVHTPDDMQAFWRRLEAAQVYSLDTETNGLFIPAPDFLIRCIAISFEDCAWVIPLEMPGSRYQGDHKRQAAFLRVLAKRAEGKTCVMWNGRYDNNALHRVHEIALYLDADGMLAHHLLDENQDHDLKYVSRVELDCPEYDLPKKEKENPDLSTSEKREAYWVYNARDAWNTLHNHFRFRKRLRADFRLNRLYNKLVMPAARVLAEIEREGMTLDLEKYTEVERRVTAERMAAEYTLNMQAGHTVNWNSRDQIADVLFNQLGLPVQQQTPTGLPSTSEEAIVDLKGQHPIINDLLKYRELDKILGTYLEGWKQYIIKDKIYFTYKQHGTVTGRFSSRLHQIPTDGDIRSVITAPKGWTFVAADLSQAELRRAAERSGDLGLVDAYRKKQDVHWNTVLFMVGAGHMPEYTAQAYETARALRRRRGADAITSLATALRTMRFVGVDACVAHWKEWKTARTNIKRVDFGFLYGMFEKTFIEKAKVDYDWICSFEQARAFRTGFFEAYPGLPRWHERCRQLVRIDGYVTNMFGRMRRLPAIHSTDKLARMEAERQAINAPVQGDIGDWKTAAMIEIHQTIDRSIFRLVGEHHDALLGIVKTGWEDKALPQLRRIMKRPRLFDDFNIDLKVPMSVDIALGAWGAGTPYKGDL